MVTTRPDRNNTIVVFVAGAVLIGGMVWVGALSSRFEYGSPMLERPHLLLVALLMGCGAAYLAAVLAVQRIPARSARITGAILAVGRLAGQPGRPWRREPTLADWVRRDLTWVLLGLSVPLGALLDRLITPLTRRAGWSNTYRVLCRRVLLSKD